MVRREKGHRYRKAQPDQPIIWSLRTSFWHCGCHNRCIFQRAAAEAEPTGQLLPPLPRVPNVAGDQIECRNQRPRRKFLRHRRQPGRLLPRIDIHPREGADSTLSRIPLASSQTGANRNSLYLEVGLKAKGRLFSAEPPLVTSVRASHCFNVLQFEIEVSRSDPVAETCQG